MKQKSMTFLKLMTTGLVLAGTGPATAQITNSAPYCAGSFVATGGGLGGPVAYIDNVTLGTLSSSTSSSTSATGYYYYNNLTAPSLTPGGTATLNVSWSMGPALHFVGAFIDFNHDNDFDDPGELIMNKSMWDTNPPNSIPSPAAQTFTIPATATTGITRLRVIAFEDDTYSLNTTPRPTVPYSCVPSTNSTFRVGQMQDYNVQIGQGSGQSAPVVSTIGAASVTGTGAQLKGTVNANGATTTASFEYGLTTSYGTSVAATPASVTGTTATAVTATITGLLPNRTYHYRAKAANAGGTTTGADITFNTIGTGVSGVLTGKGISLFPNPATDQLNIAGLDATVNAASIFDLSGRLLMRAAIPAGATLLQLNTAALSHGTYLLQLTGTGRVWRHEFTR